ncbi:smad nuclear interacting protein 1-like [Mizuhopecten yessoensis]|uniref:Smad nuclear-interacting protein 1 n=1 Tax=Mizuhopecten yessoensis TaxID=6573 RepID=A0A210QEF8_MIZYE|nr:smad nuclear interacting protein 1-like [Mizuhopecten yessoensis]OWF47126.1 Smad nuclear-interacting protein 1 [Mizuhopecten yessoensis]
MVRSFTPSDDEVEIRPRRKHQRRQSHSKSPKRESKHGKRKKKSRFDESRSSSRSPPPKRKIKIEPESPEYDERQRTRSKKHHREEKHREDRGKRKQEHKNKREEKIDPHRRIKQEPDEDSRGHRRDDDPMRRQRRERERNDDRRREARRERGNNPFRTEDDGFVYGQQEGQAQPQEQAEAEEPKDKDKPDFALSGKLTEDTNTYRGVVIKYNQPPEARKPKKRWRLYPFKGDESLPVLHIHRMSAYLMGRDRLVVDIPTDHPSCSKQHAVLQYRLVNFEREDGSKGRKVAPYIIDLDSSNGTYINNQRIDPQRYVELFEKDMLKFGFSSREYVLLHEKTDTSELAEESGSGSDN